MIKFKRKIWKKDKNFKFYFKYLDILVFKIEYKIKMHNW